MNAYEISDDWSKMADLLKEGKELLLTKNENDWFVAKSWNDFGSRIFFINHIPVNEDDLKNFLKGSGYRFIVPNKA